MATTQHRRFVFIDFNNLKMVKFKKLEKVSTKLFVFINAKETSVPFPIVEQAQKMGKNLRWIAINCPIEESLDFHLSFLMGKLHQKVERDIEFAILSNDSNLDPLINFINTSGRSCLRIKRKKVKPLEERGDVETIEPIAMIADNLADNGINTIQLNEKIDSRIIEKTAEETIDRLIRSGNRPAQIDMLKNYILLHNEELSVHGSIDRIIQKLEDEKEIEVMQEEVIYHF